MCIENDEFFIKNDEFCQAFDLKLNFAILSVLVWVTIVMIPIVMDTIRLQRARLFQLLYEKLAFVQVNFTFSKNHEFCI